MKEYTINHLSLEYLPVRVSAIKDGASYDPTSRVVAIALPVLDTDPSVWKTGSWDTSDDEYFARILVGPAGDIAPAIGDYDIYVKITDTPEVPVIRAGILHIT